MQQCLLLLEGAPGGAWAAVSLSQETLGFGRSPVNSSRNLIYFPESSFSAVQNALTFLSIFKDSDFP